MAMNPALPMPPTATPIPPTSSSTTISSSVPPSLLSHEDRIAIVRNHFIAKGYRVHSGLQFGCELVLYSDSPELVHSDFCVHVPKSSDDDGGGTTTLDWRILQTLVRMMPDLRKTLIVAHVQHQHHPVVDVARNRNVDDAAAAAAAAASDNDDDATTQPQYSYIVQELAFATEHAPFRHKYIPQGVGTQVKPQQQQQQQQSSSLQSMPKGGSKS